MKVSYVSTSAINQALRHSLMRMQAELVAGQKEANTLRVADPGLALGIQSGKAVSLNRDVARLEGIVASNAVVESRLGATQEALSQLTEGAEDFLSALTAAVSGDADPQTTAQAGMVMLETLTGIINSSFNGEHIFAGVNTDVQPLDVYSDDPPSASKAAFDAAFAAHFGFAQDDAAASGIDAAQMEAFLAGPVADEFLGAGWQTNWSSASDQVITSRIALNETAATSVSANMEGIRKLAMAATMVADLYQGNLNEAAQAAIAEEATRLVGEAMGSIANEQARIGFVEQRVSSATERISSQIDILNGFIQDMEGVDPYEVATRVNALLTQIEASYTLTSRINQLSLMRFLS